MAKQKKEKDEGEDGIPQETVDRMMVKCGRRCCICKRFRPTKLQVHHIQERAKSGTHDEDNLIVTCISCHSDVHTTTPFARRFSHAELKQHRDTLVGQVTSGYLPAEDDDDTDVVIRQVIALMQATMPQRAQFTHYATEILLRAAAAPTPMTGNILCVLHSGGTVIRIADENVISDPDNARMTAGYKGGLQQLVTYGLVECLSDSCYELTYDGYLLADELKATGDQALSDDSATGS